MARDDVVFRPAAPSDIPGLTALLTSEGLPSEDVRHAGQDYILAFCGGELVGSMGLEKRGDVALLRSLAVVPALRRRGLGGQLYDRILGQALASGAREAYVLTTTAERFFAARGFARVERSSVPEPLREAPEFRSLCPATAVCMRRMLTG
jgi:N-acetylglutamate synthase-like GNAT family acetyltransferase